MTLFLTEDQVDELLHVKDTMDIIEQSILDQGRKIAINKPRTYVKTEHVGLAMLQASVPGINRVGFKTYTTCPEGVRFWVMLFDGRAGSLDAIIEAENLSTIRTGAASGVATKYLARQDASTVAILGTGYQAASQLEAVCAARPIKKVLAWSRTPENVRKFCEKMTPRVGIPVEPAATAKEAVADADVIVTITSSKTPILMGDWIKPGAHINLAGAMKPTSREIDDRTLARASVMTVDDWKQAHGEAGEFIEGVANGVMTWDQVKELGDVMAGNEPGRKSDQDITLFKSHGIGIWDVAAGQRVLEIALKRKVGTVLPIAQAARQLGNGLDPSRLKP
jgi:ornithine cyclodeaminase/alanine dehydrogenase-like protein (mu-crystallin family)